jgi:Sulfotransferase family
MNVAADCISDAGHVWCGCSRVCVSIARASFRLVWAPAFPGHVRGMGTSSVSSQRPKGRSRPAELPFSPEELVVRANALFHGEQSKDLRGVIAEKIEDLRHLDVPAMDRIAAILMWGRSGSLLLASYLDGHDDVIMLPESCGQRLYDFFESYRSLSLRDKLIGYAAIDDTYPRFFEGDFAISAEKYYAAVEAILEVYGSFSPDFLESRRAFFLFIHVAYNLALGRRPGSSSPLIVYAQHVWDNDMASHLVEDFPRAKFVHTIRDPISSCDGIFHYHFKYVEHHILLPYMALSLLVGKDRPQSGMESRTHVIRFEDLHRDTAATMHDLADWLGLAYQETLLDSTFNGVPWVVTRDGEAWTGRRLAQVQRHSRNLSRKDRALLFALFYQNFADWNYPFPKVFGHLMVRCFVFSSLFLVPMKMEFTAARVVFKRRILPSLRRGAILPAIRSTLAIGLCRVKIIRLMASVFFRRFAHGTTLLQVGLNGVEALGERRNDQRLSQAQPSSN